MDYPVEKSKEANSVVIKEEVNLPDLNFCENEVEEFFVKSEPIDNAENCQIFDEDEPQDLKPIIELLDGNPNNIKEKEKGIGISFNKKRIFCIHCKKFQTQFARHVKRKHGNKKDVQDAIKAGSKAWTSFTSSLGKKGQFYYNILILEKGEGDILVCRTPFDSPEEGKKMRASDYISCAYCLGFFKITNLKRHLRVCEEAKTDNTSEEHKMAKSYSLMPLLAKNDIDRHFLENILLKINNDLRSTILRDEIIVSLGERLYFKYDMTQEMYIRETLRKLAYLLLEISKEKNKELTLLEILNVDFFDDIVNATLKLSGISEDKKILEHPSFALKIGYALIKAIEVAKSLHIKSRNLEGLNKVEELEKLMKNDWSGYVCSKAYVSIKENQLNKQDEFPDETDVEKLENFLEEKLIEPQNQSYRMLVNLILAALTIYNFRRASEPVKITVEGVNRALENTENLDYMVEEEELKPASNVKVVRVPGRKAANDCPVIMKPEVFEAVKRLLTLRETAGVTENPFLFALPGSESSTKRAADAVKDVVNLADKEVHFKDKSLLTSTKLRKYYVMVLQMRNFTDSEKKLINDHVNIEETRIVDIYIKSEEISDLPKKKLRRIETEEAEIR